MSISRKYGRTYHFPFSPGTTSDDRIHHSWWDDIEGKEMVHTEKLDGENTCLNSYGVFARSHAAPTRHPWAGYLKEKWNWIKNDLGNLEIFGENLYAIHSIEYVELEHHFYVFAVREKDRWLSWEEVGFYAALLDFPLVPVLGTERATDQKQFRENALSLAGRPGTFGTIDAASGETCKREGIVSRNAGSFPVSELKPNVLKYVRANHVKTDEHWTRKWKRAPLKHERRST